MKKNVDLTSIDWSSETDTIARLKAFRADLFNQKKDLANQFKVAKPKAFVQIGDEKGLGACRADFEIVIDNLTSTFGAVDAMIEALDKHLNMLAAEKSQNQLKGLQKDLSQEDREFLEAFI